MYSDSLDESGRRACRLANVGELTTSLLSAVCVGACGAGRDFEELLLLNGDGRLQDNTLQKFAIHHICHLESISSSLYKNDTINRLNKWYVLSQKRWA